MAAAAALGLLLVLGGWGCRTRAAAPAPPRPEKPLATSKSPAPPGPASAIPNPVAAPAQRTAEPPDSPSAAVASAPRTPGLGNNDPATKLINSLEIEFAAARRLYQAGQMDEARAGFDATLDRLLAVHMSIPGSSRLQAELNSLLDRTQAMESDVMHSGGLTNTQPQATPLDRIPELTFPLDEATRRQIEAETQRASQRAAARGRQQTLPLVVNDAVMRYIHYFTTRGREDFEQGYRRAGRYRDMADRIFREVGVPDNLLYLAQLESGFDPRSVSSVGARGMWQFMAVRSDDYGLKRTHWVDERMNPEKSTLAAARHLRDLHNEFGDWYLAMAAYVAGPRPVEEAVARTGYADFWKLCDLHALSTVVRDYVPVILAIALISQSPDEYGFHDLEVDPPQAVDQVKLDSNLDLRLAAECAGVTLHDLQFLNPSLLHYLAPPGFVLKLPQGTAGRFAEALKVVPPADRIRWRLHWVRPGESWGQLSRRYGLSVASLTRVNHQSSSQPPMVGTPLALPHGGPAPIRRSRKATHRR